MAVITGIAGPEKKRPAVSMKKRTTGNSTSKTRDFAPSAGRVETSTPARPPRSTTPASLESASVGTRPSNPGKAGTLVSVQASVSTSLLGGGAQAAESHEQPEFQIEVPIKSSEPLEHDHQEFEVPVDGENSGIRAQETRSEQLIAEQEAGVQHALETGEPVTFVNAQGNSEQISVNRA